MAGARMLYRPGEVNACLLCVDVLRSRSDSYQHLRRHAGERPRVLKIKNDERLFTRLILPADERLSLSIWVDGSEASAAVVKETWIDVRKQGRCREVEENHRKYQELAEFFRRKWLESQQGKKNE
jgi:hypothetical protein